MVEEVLIEEGIVTKVTEKEIEIELIKTGNCDNCGTKDFCKGGEIKTITLKNEYDLSMGDKVIIEVRGKTILKTVFLLYGIPLLILILSFLISYQILEVNKELIASSVSFTFIGIYYLLMATYFRKFENQFKVNLTRMN
ncbi:MAG: SoxR reducing system RseC family protein [Ignavibacteria bacterium]